MRFPRNLKNFVVELSWTFAKTYASTWPHEYVVRGRVDEDLFTQLVEHIRTYGDHQRPEPQAASHPVPIRIAARRQRTEPTEHEAGADACTGKNVPTITVTFEQEYRGRGPKELHACLFGCRRPNRQSLPWRRIRLPSGSDFDVSITRRCAKAV